MQAHALAEQEEAQRLKEEAEAPERYAELCAQRAKTAHKGKLLKGVKRLHKIQPLFKTLGHEIAKDESQSGLKHAISREICQVQGLLKQQESKLKSIRIRKAAKATATEHPYELC